MQIGRSLLCCALMLTGWGPALADSPEQIRARQAQARSQQADLQKSLQALQKDIDASESSRREVATELRASERAISDAGRRLQELGEQQAQTESDIAELQQQAQLQRQTLAARQAGLAAQLRAQYASGLSPWAALLSGDDPQAISRELGYLSYVSQAQADTIRQVRQALDDLSATETRLLARQQDLVRLSAETTQQKAEFEQQKAEREKVLVRISAQLRDQRDRSDALKRDEQRLGRLVQGLEATLARQAEQARLAAERQRQEAARRQAEAERARVQQAAREQAEQARAQAAQAQSQAQQAAQATREQVEQARAQATPEQPQTQAAVTSRPAVSAPVVVDGGLHKGLPMPVRGNIQGRFGAERPDGGVWRGIVLRAAEGAPVKSIAPGRVVYANWLKGFGNMLIVDHGQQYMSIYAYNQSLLKAVGDSVGAGEAIATVGATGGQVESGLYFEIRHEGAPVNPLLWLNR